MLVAGEAKRGKSTLVNVLLGRIVLPMGVTPLTALATTVRYGQEEGATAVFRDGRAESFLGEPTSAGMHAGTLSFTATRPGSYRYLCPVPGHAQEGMSGSFTVESTS